MAETWISEGCSFSAGPACCDPCTGSSTYSTGRLVSPARPCTAQAALNRTGLLMWLS